MVYGYGVGLAIADQMEIAGSISAAVLSSATLFTHISLCHQAV